MDDIFFVGTTEAGSELYVSELSRQTLEDNGMQAESACLYLYETDNEPSGSGIRVLASLPTMDSVYRLVDLFGMRLAAA
jgi:hypothetical protein